MRLGAYGDPAALPVALLQKLTVHAPNHTSYSHQWEDASDELKEKIRRWSTSGSRIESLFTLISFHFLEEIKKEEKKREETKNDN